jgi:hypothetical protein
LPVDGEENSARVMAGSVTLTSKSAMKQMNLHTRVSWDFISS